MLPFIVDSRSDERMRVGIDRTYIVLTFRENLAGTYL